MCAGWDLRPAHLTGGCLAAAAAGCAVALAYVLTRLAH